MSLTKAELTARLADAADITKKQAEGVIAALIDTIHDVVRSGGEISINDLGKFSTSARPARKGRNPLTGEAIDIAAKTAPKFSAAKALKDAANQPPAKKSKK